MFFEPQRTNFDLTWRMFGIPVRVHPTFWLFTALLGWPALELGFEYLAIWILCAFVSILVHEFGHALTARAYGLEPHVVLYTMGGLAIHAGGLRSRARRIAITLAGPAAGFLLYGVVRLLRESGTLPARMHPLLDEAVFDLLAINLYWNLLNLLPIWPLDGGQVCMEVCTHYSRRHGEKNALVISIATAALFSAYSLIMHYRPIDELRFLTAWVPPSLYVGLLFAFLAVESFMRLQEVNSRGSFSADDRTPWER